MYYNETSMIKGDPLHFRLILGICFCVILFTIGSTDITKAVVSSSLLMINAVVLFLAIRKEAYDVLVLAFFMLSYSYVPFAHYYLGQDINIRVQAYSASTVYHTACLCLLFQIVLWMNTSMKNVSHFRFTQKSKNYPAGVFYILIILSLLFTIFGLQGDTILTSGSYGNALATRESSSVFSYAIITITLAYVYAGNKKRLIIVYSLVAFYSIKILLFGGRIEAIQLWIALFLIKFRFVWSRKIILLSAGGAYFLMSLWSVYRADTSVSLFNIDNDTLRLTGGDVYYASMRILYLIDQGVLSIADRAEAFLYYLSSSILPFRVLPDIANLSVYLSDQYASGGGGLAPVFFFAFGGIPMVIIAAALISYFLNRMHKNKYYYFYGIMLVATVPRWFAYYPIQPIKFCVYAVLLFAITENILKRFLNTNG